MINFVKQKYLKILKRDKMLYLMVLPALVSIVIFKYLPIYGIKLAFFRYRASSGLFGGEWVGLAYFIRFFNDPYCYRVLRNTFLLGLYTLIFSFPAPIMFALLLNEIKEGAFKRVTQTVSYMPHFLSIVIIVGFMIDIFSLSDGVINNLVETLGGERIHFFAKPEWFRTLYIGSYIWQEVGYSAIIYLAAISGINPELYESSEIDGANRWQKIKYITLPGIFPTISIMLILSVGGILGNDFQKILLMQNKANMDVSDVVSTFIYRNGLLGADYSYSTAVGLFLSLISFFFLYVANRVSKKISEYYLW